MIPEVAQYVPTTAEHKAVRHARASFLVRRRFYFGGREGLADFEERVACRDSEHEFKVVEANDLVRLFMLVSVDADGKSRWLSKYVDDWLDIDSAIDDLIARASA